MRAKLWIKRAILILSILMIGFGKTIMVRAAQTPKDYDLGTFLGKEYQASPTNLPKYCNAMREPKFYLEGSDAGKTEQSGKSEVIGDWIFVSNDGKQISQWNFDSSDILTIDYYSNEKDSKQTFTTSRNNTYLVVNMAGKTYNLRKKYTFDELSYYEVSGDLQGILVRKDSEEGKYYIKKAKTIYKTGKMLQRTHYNKFKNDLFPEVKAISVSLECRSNLWLKDEINVEENPKRYLPYPGGCGLSYIVDSKIKLKNAKITFTYDESELPYAYEKDLVIVHIDSKTMKSAILKTTRNLKSNKVAATITEGGLYYLADSVVFNGGSRDITKRNPKTTEWARNENTGDIISLVDLEYIKNSNGDFVVSTVSELASVVYYVNTTLDAYPYVTLEKDIDLSGYEWAPMGWEYLPGASFWFQGKIEGNNHTIRNLHIDNEGSNVGLLGWAQFAGVYNLNITNAVVNGGSDIGILTGLSIRSFYENCHAEGVVNGYGAGSLVGYDANNDFIECSADVIVNGDKFNFLSWNEKEISKIVIEDYVPITMDETYTITRPEVTGYDMLTWSVYCNGRNVLDADAENHITFQYYRREPGDYTVYLTAYVQGQYVRVSNEIKYHIK